MSAARSAIAFRDHAIARLQTGAILYGDASYHRPIGELLSEISEELVDVAAWGTIALDAIQRDPNLTTAERTVVQAAVIDAAGQAEVSYRRIADVSRALTPAVPEMG